MSDASMHDTVKNAAEVTPREVGADETMGSTYRIDRAMELRILRKFDLILIPTLAIMYLFNAIDKSNLGNAKTDGMTEDLHFTGNQYNLLLTIFFIPLILFCTPVNLLSKKFGASRVLPIEMLIFGSMTLVSAAATNFAEMVVIRIILGAAESAILPGVIFYLTTFYKRTELARRLCCFYAAAQIAGAFSGLIAYGVFQIEDDAKLQGWQYLFLIEGGLTLVLAIVAWLVLPRSAATAYFLTPAERELAALRLELDSSAAVDVDFSFKEAIKVFTQDKLWIPYGVIGFCLCVPLFSVGTFLPQIVAQFALDSSVKTNLYTVAPNLVGACFVIGLAFSSDYFKERCIHIAAAMCVTATGFIILACTDTIKHYALGYFACFMVSSGAFVTSPLWSSWYSNNTPDENQRAVLAPVMVALANTSAFVASNIFTDATAPRYIPASAVCAGFGFFGAALVVALGWWMKWDNERRNREQGVVLRAGDVPTSELKMRGADPRWRWMGGLK